jgi:gamma-glutamylaminecyclotransferase
MTMNSDSDLVFVYGTLKRGLGNHRVMQGAGGEFVTAARTEDSFPLVVDGLPYLLDMPGCGHRVEGEVYRVSSDEGWARLDRLEGHPNFYRRRVITVLGEDGTRHEAWAYFVVRGVERLERGEFLERY